MRPTAGPQVTIIEPKVEPPQMRAATASLLLTGMGCPLWAGKKSNLRDWAR